MFAESLKGLARGDMNEFTKNKGTPKKSLGVNANLCLAS